MRPTTLVFLFLLALTAPAAEPPVFSIRAFGAKDFKDEDKHQDRFKNTRAIADAIEQATTAPTYQTTGSIVRIPRGKWLTGPIELKSNITLQLDKEATLVFSDDPADDPPVQLTRWEGIECKNFAGFIRARNAKNVAISGKGTIDANGRGWWKMFRTQEAARRKLRELGRLTDDPNQREFAMPAQWPDDVFRSHRGARDAAEGLRPSFIEFIGCQNVRLEGFTVRNVPMYAIHPIYCEDVVCSDLHVVALGADGNGVVPDSCKRVWILDCTFDCQEDGVSVKSGRDTDGLRVNLPTEDVTIKGCHFIRGASGVAIGSETSGGVRKINVTQCNMKGVARGLRIKTMRGRGGEISDVKFTLCRLSEIGEAGVVIDMQLNPTDPKNFSSEELIPKVGKILIRGIDCDGGWKPWLVRGLPESPIVGLTLADVKLKADRGIECRHVSGGELKQVEVNAKDGWTLYASDVQDWYVERLKPIKAPKDGAVIAVRDARTFSVKLVRAPEETDIFLRVAGKQSEDITLNKCDTQDAKQPVRVEDGATGDVVKEVE
jgi:hypothetical protein